MDAQSLYTLQFDQLPVSIYRSKQELGQAAAQESARIIDQAIRAKDLANIIIATGNSQLTFLSALRTVGIDWSKVNIFHMDEYIGLDPAHPASFPLFLKMHIVNYIQPKAFFPIPPSTLQNAEKICKDYEKLLRAHPADLCALGIGENGHLAFNDPPFADFKDPLWAKIVKLDDASRRQQVGEGHFKNVDEVPTHAITLTIPALLAAQNVLALVPEERKVDAVYRSLNGPISEECPGSILRKTPHAHLYLDTDSAKKILPPVLGA
jgi:glucosamine-6-phosphate deaminase